MVRDAERILGCVAVLFNNAMADPRDDYTDDQRWNVMLESGLAAYWAASIEGAPLLERSGCGRDRIECIDCGRQDRNRVRERGVQRSEGGVVGLTRKLAQRLGPRGIRVNCVCPESSTPRGGDRPASPSPASLAAGGRWLRSDASDARKRSRASFCFSRATRRCS